MAGMQDAILDTEEKVETPPEGTPPEESAAPVQSGMFSGAEEFPEEASPESGEAAPEPEAKTEAGEETPPETPESETPAPDAPPATPEPGPLESDLKEHQKEFAPDAPTLGIDWAAIGVSETDQQIAEESVLIHVNTVVMNRLVASAKDIHDGKDGNPDYDTALTESGVYTKSENDPALAAWLMKAQNPPERAYKYALELLKKNAPAPDPPKAEVNGNGASPPPKPAAPPPPAKENSGLNGMRGNGVGSDTGGYTIKSLVEMPIAEYAKVPASVKQAALQERLRRE